MTKRPEYIKFVEEDASHLKTRLVVVKTVSSEAELGWISWYGPWRQYVFKPRIQTIFNPDCLMQISGEVAKMSRDHSEARRRSKCL